MSSFLLWLPILFWFCNPQTITISTKLGQIKGSVQNTSWSSNVYLFAGIRYANPPLNDLRFRPAQILNVTYTGTYDATKFGAECTQPESKNSIPISEDCLYLNIWTKNVEPVNKLLPVMFYIHGGSMVVGSGADPETNGNNMVAEIDGNFVMVSINYRLGSLGWLQNEALYDEDPNWKSYGGMNGLYDQITALKWVKNNIADYGGDPSQITIFGESAGGLSVCYLLLSPKVPDNIFQRAIVESGACNGAWGVDTAHQGLNTCNVALRKAGYPINNLTYLRSVDAATFYNNVQCGCCVDDLILTEQAGASFDGLVTGQYTTWNAKDGIIIGWTSVDGLAEQYGGYAPSTEKEWSETISYYFPNKTQQNLMENVYYAPSRFSPQGKANQYEMAWYTIISDACLGCTSLLIAEQTLQSKATTNNVFVYVFGGPTSSKTGQSYAPHGAELSFIFDWEQYNEFSGVPWSQSLSNSMVSAWTNFGIDGYPNITNKYNKINIFWNGFDDNKSMMVWNETGKVISSTTYQNGACQFLNTNNGFSLADICRDVPIK